MRWLLRIIITWAILLPLSYFIGLPYAADKLTQKTRQDTLTQCAQQLRDKGLLGDAQAALTQAQGDQYCHCLSDPLTLTREDILAMAKQRMIDHVQAPPARFEAQLKAQVDTCNTGLQQAIIEKYRNAAGAAAPVSAPPSAPTEPGRLTPGQTITIN